MLSHVVDEAALLATLRRYIGLVIPGDLSGRPRASTKHPLASGSRELGRAMRDAVFQLACVQRARERLVHYFYSSGAPQTKAADRLLDFPYVYILLLGVGFLVMTAVASLLQSMSDDQLVVLGRGWSLDRLSVVLLYLIGVAGLILVLTSIYLVMPPKGRIRPRHALIGGIAVGLLWEATQPV